VHKGHITDIGKIKAVPVQCGPMRVMSLPLLLMLVFSIGSIIWLYYCSSSMHHVWKAVSQNSRMCPNLSYLPTTTSRLIDCHPHLLSLHSPLRWTACHSTSWIAFSDAHARATDGPDVLFLQFLITSVMLRRLCAITLSHFKARTRYAISSSCSMIRDRNSPKPSPGPRCRAR
jgi:hypothetical protein